MEGASKIETILKLILYLSGSFGHSSEEIENKFGFSDRTVYRYIEALRNAGFIVDKKNGIYKINREEGFGKSISDLLNLSEDEAYILNKAMHSINGANPYRENLIKKLHAVYDFDRIAKIVVDEMQAENVHSLIKAIREKKQVLLRNYHSANSDIVRDRQVEPISFTTNYVSVWAFEPESQSNKLFKVQRIGNVVNLHKTWHYETQHKAGHEDIFRMSSDKKLPIKLRLSMRAASLLKEEFPLANEYLSEENDKIYIFETEVCSYHGVGRFVLGLADEVKVIENKEFINYLNEKIKRLQF